MKYETRTQIDEPIKRMYWYGSRVYRTHTDTSDYDYIAVVESDDDELYYTVSMENKDYTVYSEKKFIKMIREHKIHVLECIFQTEDDPYAKYFELNLSNLRHSISSVSSNSFGKAGKKMKQGDIYIGKKSLSHSLRILDYGIQIGIYGKIHDYASMNGIHIDIMENESTDWNEYKELYQKGYNSMKTFFRVVAPLEEDV